VLQDRERKQKSPSPAGSPRSPPHESEVNPPQELTKICHEYFNNPLEIEWKASIFGVDNAGVPLYIYMQDILEIIQGN